MVRRSLALALGLAASLAATARSAPADPAAAPTAVDPLAGHPALRGAARAAMRQACAARAADCDEVGLLGGLERAALARALRQRGLRLVRAPAGRTIGAIHVVTLPVLGDEGGIL